MFATARRYWGRTSDSTGVRLNASGRMRVTISFLSFRAREMMPKIMSTHPPMWILYVPAMFKGTPSLRWYSTVHVMANGGAVAVNRWQIAKWDAPSHDPSKYRAPQASAPALPLPRSRNDEKTMPSSARPESPPRGKTTSRSSSPFCARQKRM